MQYIYLTILGALLAGCASQSHRPAPVVFKGDSAGKTAGQEDAVQKDELVEEEVDVSAAILADEAPRTHTVAVGETLLTITNLYSIEIGALVQANDLKPPYNLQPGQKLVIPKKGTADKPFGVVESVQVGDLGAPVAGEAMGVAASSTMTPADTNLPPLVRDLKTRYKLQALGPTAPAGAVAPQGAMQTPEELLETEADLPPPMKRPTKADKTAKKSSNDHTKLAGGAIGTGESMSTGAVATVGGAAAKAVTPGATSQPAVVENDDDFMMPSSDLEDGLENSVAPSMPEALPLSAPTMAPAARASVPQEAGAAPAAMAATGFIRPVDGDIIMRFGEQNGNFQNDGVNFAAPRGAPIRAVADGSVAYRGNELRGFGNLVLVKHADGWISAYAHADKILVQRGDMIKQGQQIASVGSTGNVTTPQLHFELRRGNVSVDPMQYIR